MHGFTCSCVKWRNVIYGEPHGRTILAREFAHGEARGYISADPLCRCGGTGYADSPESLAREMANALVATHGRLDEAGMVAADYRNTFLAEIDCGPSLTWHDVIRPFRERWDALLAAHRAARATAPTLPAPAARGEGERDSALSNSAALRDLAGVLAMREDATRAAIAERAAAEIKRLNVCAIVARQEIERLRAFEFDALDARLANIVRPADPHTPGNDMAVDSVRRARALLRALREQLAAVDADVGAWDRYRLAMGTLAGRGHPVPEPHVLLTDLQVDE